MANQAFYQPTPSPAPVVTPPTSAPSPIWGIILGLIGSALLIFGLFMPAACPDSFSCSLDQGAILSPNHFEDANISQGLAYSVRGIPFLALSILSATTFLLNSNNTVILRFFSLGATLNLCYLLCFVIHNNDDPRWGWGALFGGAILMLIASFILNKTRETRIKQGDPAITNYPPTNSIVIIVALVGLVIIFFGTLMPIQRVKEGSDSTRERLKYENALFDINRFNVDNSYYTTSDAIFDNYLGGSIILFALVGGGILLIKTENHFNLWLMGLLFIIITANLLNYYHQFNFKENFYGSTNIAADWGWGPLFIGAGIVFVASLVGKASTTTQVAYYETSAPPPIYPQTVPPPQSGNPVDALLNIATQNPNGVWNTPAEQQIQTIGQQLYTSGGIGAMQNAHMEFTQRLSSVSPQAYQNGWSRHLDSLWEGIGQWRG